MCRRQVTPGGKKRKAIALMDQETFAQRNIEDVEIQEWLESLDSVLESSGPEVAREILERYKLVDPALRAAAYRESGWTSFDPNAPLTLLTKWRRSADVTSAAAFN